MSESDIPMQTAFFTKQLADQCEAGTNILLFGLAGSTKSSFVNSCLSLLSDRIMNSAAVGGSSTHITQKLLAYNLADLDPAIKCTLWDTWGLTPTTYQGTELEDILLGKLPSGYSMHKAVSNSSETLVALSDTENFKARRIHSIIFFIPGATVLDPSLHSSAFMQQSIRALNSIIQKGYNPIILLTKVDELVLSYCLPTFRFG